MPWPAPPLSPAPAASPGQVGRGRAAVSATKIERQPVAATSAVPISGAMPGPTVTIRFIRARRLRRLGGRALSRTIARPSTMPAQPPSAWKARAAISAWIPGASAAASPPRHRAPSRRSAPAGGRNGLTAGRRPAARRPGRGCRSGRSAATAGARRAPPRPAAGRHEDMHGHGAAEGDQREQPERRPRIGTPAPPAPRWRRPALPAGRAFRWAEGSMMRCSMRRRISIAGDLMASHLRGTPGARRQPPSRASRRPASPGSARCRWR